MGEEGLLGRFSGMVCDIVPVPTCMIQCLFVGYAMLQNLVDDVFVSFNLRDLFWSSGRVHCGHVAGWLIAGFVSGINVDVLTANQSFVHSRRGR